MILRRALRILLGLAALVSLPALASPSGVVISGFQVRGPAGGNDEYVELRNAGSSSVTIAGWKLQGCASGTPGTASTRAIVVSGVSLAPGQYYLFTNNASSGYSGTVVGDATYATGFTDFSNSNYSGIQLVDASSAVQDAVGSPLSPCHEGTGISTPTTSSANDAYARNGGGATDTGNNASDFAGPQASNPHDSGGISISCANDGLHIYSLQGKSHISPYNGKCVSNVPGIVTQLSTTGFYMQDGDGDGDVTTSDGIFVYTSSAPTVTVGSEVKVSGTLDEYRPGGTGGSNNLTTTEIDSPVITVASSLFSNNSISPTVIGTGGRIPPTQFIDSGTTGSVEVASETTYDPSVNGIDFYESLEGMLVQVNNAVVVGPTDSYGEIWLVGDAGANATGINARSGITLVNRDAGADFNPERVQIDLSDLTSTYPQQNVGDSTAKVVGVVGYGFSDYRIYPAAIPTFTSGGLQPVIESLVGGAQFVNIGAYNVDNLDPNDNDVCDGAPDQDIASGKYAKLGAHIATNLRAPAILSIEEIQDNDGCADDGVVDATLTISTLTQAIVTAGGPSYSYVEIDPVNDLDGGVPGGNIRQIILYDATRVTFVAGTQGAGNSTTATALTTANGSLQLSLSPGRIDPSDAAWTTSRKPLAATFDVNGLRLLVISNHLDSKGGDEPLYGPYQPPVLSSATQRQQQAQIVHDFVAQALSLDANARIVVLGDFNDYEFATPLQVLSGQSVGAPILTDLSAALLPETERYGYVYEGNSEELDHIYVSNALLSGAQFQPIHVNSEFASQASDHDPLLSSLNFPVANKPPVANAGPDQTVTAKRKTTVTLSGSASYDPDGSIVSYQWAQLSGTAVSLTGAQTATASFTAPTGAATLLFQLTVTDNKGAQASDSVTITLVKSGRGGRSVSEMIEDAELKVEDRVFGLLGS